MITVRDLVFDYPTKRALHGLTFDIEGGSVTALVGPNGAGKTTLMRCLAALDTPLEGVIVVDGIDVMEEPREAHARIGYLQDFFGLYDDLSVRRCLTYFAAAHRVPAAERAERVERVAGWLGLADRLHEKAGTLSRGLRQRLAIAQAIIHEPRVLILDEPASGLDPEARSGLSRLIRMLRERGMTIIVSSHILTELEDYSTHMMMVRGGRIIEHCPIGEHAAEARRRLRVELTAPAAEWLASLECALAPLGHTRLAGHQGERLELELSGDRADQVEVLRALVGAGLPVAAFGAVTTSMQDVYLERLKQQVPA